MNSLLDRFLRYVRIDTQSNENSSTVPSTFKQLDLCRLLEAECRELNLADVSLDEFGIVMATVPATLAAHAPTTAWVAHVDTSPETSGTSVKPIVHSPYAGGDIVLPGDPTKVIQAAENPDLERLVGGTIITTDGTTLLGADDKAGVAVIMSAAARLVAHPEIPHGPIRLCFTCDEEIGHGARQGGHTQAGEEITERVRQPPPPAELESVDSLAGHVTVSQGRPRVREARAPGPARPAEPVDAQRRAAAPAPRRRDPLEGLPACAAEGVAPAGAEQPVAHRTERRKNEVEGGDDPRPPAARLEKRYGRDVFQPRHDGHRSVQRPCSTPQAAQR